MPLWWVMPTVAIPYSNVKVAIAQILKDEGYIEDYHGER